MEPFRFLIRTWNGRDNVSGGRNFLPVFIGAFCMVNFLDVVVGETDLHLLPACRDATHGALDRTRACSLPWRRKPPEPIQYRAMERILAASPSLNEDRTSRSMQEAFPAHSSISERPLPAHHASHNLLTFAFLHTCDDDLLSPRLHFPLELLADSIGLFGLFSRGRNPLIEVNIAIRAPFTPLANVS